MKVLIVDDDAPTANLIAATLRNFASRIEIANTIAQAREWVKRMFFNLILLDLGMPDSTPQITIGLVPEFKVNGTKVAVLTGAWPPESPLPETVGADAVFYKGQPDLREKLRALCLPS